MIPQTTELSQIQAAFIDKDNRIEELMRQINSAQSLLNSRKETTNSLVGNGKITIKTYAGSNVGDFTVNQKEDKTITLPQQSTVETADKVANAITFSNDGAGAASGSTFDGSAARKLSWNSIGACPDTSELMFCTNETFTQDGVTHLRIKAQGHISSLVNDKYYYIATPRYTINNTTNNGYLYLNINNLGDKLLRWGCAPDNNNIITRQFSLPQGIYAVRYSSSDNSFYLYFDESLNGRIFQRYGTGYATCFGRSDIDGYYFVRRLNPIRNTITLAFTGADNYGYGLVENVKVDGWSNEDTTFIMFYNHTNKTLTNVQKLYFNYSYIVDSNAKLDDWANNVAGNDYTSVLIKKGSWSTNYSINLTTTGTKVVVGEEGSILNINANNTTVNGAFGYETTPTTPNYYIQGVKIIARGSNSGHAFSHCAYLRNCIALGNTNKIGFARSSHLRDCVADGTFAFGTCEDISDCKAIADGTISNRGRGFSECLAVRNCSVGSGFVTAYYQSYFSPTANATYACANTLNGGWNTTA